MLSLLYQLPNRNLFTQHVSFIFWRDTTSELWTPVQFPLHCYNILLLLALFTFLHNIMILPLDTLNSLFTANRWDRQPHRKLGGKFLVVLCVGFTLLLGEDTLTISGAIVQSVMKLASITFWSLVLSPTGSINLGFTTEGACCCAHHTYSWGSQLVGHLYQHRTIKELFPAPCRRPSPPPWSPLEWCVSSLPWTTGS
jgi:hypothetical protein